MPSRLSPLVVAAVSSAAAAAAADDDGDGGGDDDDDDDDDNDNDDNYDDDDGAFKKNAKCGKNPSRYLRGSRPLKGTALRAAPRWLHPS